MQEKYGLFTSVLQSYGNNLTVYLTVYYVEWTLYTNNWEYSSRSYFLQNYGNLRLLVST